MKNTFRKVKKSSNIQHGLHVGLIQAAMVIVLWLAQPQVGLQYLVLGTVGVLGTIMLLAGARLVTVVVEGEIVEQQPQLTDVQSHMHCTPELSQAA